MIAADGYPLRVARVCDLILKEKVIWADGLTVDDVIISVVISVHCSGPSHQQPLQCGMHLVLDVLARPVIAQCNLRTLRLDDVVVRRRCGYDRDRGVAQRKPSHDVSVDVKQQVNRLALAAVRPSALVDKVRSPVAIKVKPLAPFEEHGA